MPLLGLLRGCTFPFRIFMQYLQSKSQSCTSKTGNKICSADSACNFTGLNSQKETIKLKKTEMYVTIHMSDTHTVRTLCISTQFIMPDQGIISQTRLQLHRRAL